LKKLIGIIAIIIVVGASTYFLTGMGKHVLENPAQVYDHNPSEFLKVDGSITQALDTVNKMLDKGQINLEQAKQLTDKLIKEAEKADKILDDAGITEEKRKKTLEELQKISDQVIEQLKKVED